MKRFFENEKGSTAALFASGAGVIALAAMLAIDSSIVLKTQAQTQNALDASLLAAIIRTDLSDSEKVEYGRAVFMQNMPSSPDDVSYSLESSGENLYMANVNVVTDLPFAGLVDINDIIVNARSTTEYALTEIEIPVDDTAPSFPNVMGDACIILTGSAQWQSGLLMNSGAKIASDVCEIHVHNPGSNAITVNSNIVLDVPKVCVAGSNGTDNRSSQDLQNGDPVQYGCAPEPVPYPNGVPAYNTSSCDYQNLNFDNQNEITLHPGVYCGWLNFNLNSLSKKVHMEPGVYVLKNGGWNVNGGTWTGQGVTFYFDSSNKIQFNSGTSVDISAPATGDYAGIVITDGPNVGNYPQDFILNSASNFRLTGLVNLPNRNVTLNSDSTVHDDYFALVANRLIVNSNASINQSRVEDAPSAVGTGDFSESGTSTTTTTVEVETATTSSAAAEMGVEAILRR